MFTACKDYLLLCKNFCIIKLNSWTESSGNEYSEYRTVDEAHEAVDLILRENPDLSNRAKDMIRGLRTDIYKALDGETSARISIYVGDENKDKPFKFKIGTGSLHLIVNILNDEVRNQFSSRRFWTRVYKSANGIVYGVFAVVNSIKYAIENKKTQ